MFVNFYSHARPLPFRLVRRALRRFIAVSFIFCLPGGDPLSALPCSAVWLSVFIIK